MQMIFPCWSSSNAGSGKRKENGKTKNQPQNPGGLGPRPAQNATSAPRNPNPKPASTNIHPPRGPQLSPKDQQLLDDLIRMDATLHEMFDRYQRSLRNSNEDRKEYGLLYDILRAFTDVRLHLLSMYHMQANEQVQDVVSRFDAIRPKLVPVFEVIEAEIVRFEGEMTVLEQSFENMAASTTTTTELQAVFLGDMDNIKLELVVYSKKWSQVVGPDLQDRLEKVASRIRELENRFNEKFQFFSEFDAIPASAATTQTFNPLIREKTRTRNRTKSMSSRQNSRAEGPLAHVFRKEPETFEQYQRQLSRKKSKRPKEMSQGTSGAHDSAVVRRTSTLRMMAALVHDNSTSAAPTIPTPNSTISAVGGGGGGSGASSPPHLEPQFSFSSTLYQTMNLRQASIVDIGYLLTVSKVRGDGRCLFRSVAKSRAFANGMMSVWNEDMERTEADRLRNTVIRELHAHRELLLTYCVVEGDFDKYCRKMANPRTFGGEPELLMLALTVHHPIAVYLRQGMHFKQIQVYGRQYSGEPCYILYSDGIHYDCLVPAHQF
mmetsp:Transcript_4127/g.7522  ORF Transcript_4127/g.7522 Transcript_4127/m.7522 type:complete len:547 (-) Transcript_4127:70-1710(-)|eukprot:CAMPEP_0184700374 /NCGR_PEP_ID=MMETSP0313-20130426/12659_1 /TAXON_ID=2792 /ORGANISM="Porphyridium aerugineum, Strain SAG 1380-2" /LENGTH=546 /DNA_ID=CAMNT_0027160009 /DNA_START=312 /DNA_END=1952 /DNA_ORIENTATION=+